MSRALRKEPEARYSSVEALAEDIRLHLDGRAIHTRRDDWRYRTGKIVRRNSGVVSAALLILVLGVSFTINTVVQARALARERDRAEAQRATAERVSSFLGELFTEADPNAMSSRDVTLRDVLDRGAEQVVGGLEDEPETRAALATLIGRVYNSLGEYDAAQPVLDTAVAVRRRLERMGDAEGAGDTWVERGALAYNLGRYDEAVIWFDSSLVFYGADGGATVPVLAGAMSWLAVAHADHGDVETAETVMRETVAMLRDADPDDATAAEELAVALKSLQDILRDVGKVDEAVDVGFEALARSREVWGDEHPETAHALNQIGSSLRAAGRADEAIPLVEEGLEIRRAVFGEAHVEIAASLGNLANLMASVGRDAEALRPRRESVAMLASLFPPDHPYVAGSTTSLGTVLLQNDSLQAAEGVLLDGLRYSRMAFPEGHPVIANALSSLGTLYRRTDRFEESTVYLTEALEIRTAALPEDHWNVGASELELGRTYEALRRDADAERHLAEAYRILELNFGAEDERTVRAREALQAHYTRRGLADRAAALSGD